MVGSWLVTGMIWLAGLCSWTATLMSLWAVWSHCKHYSQPNLQRWVVRIIVMVPVYALTAWASLISVESAYYLDALRDVYEAFVIYCFVSLLISYFGGERAFLLVMHDSDPTPLFWPASLVRKDLDLSDPYDYLFLKRGILQYVVVKPTLAAATMLMRSMGVYREGSWGLTSGYMWTQLVYNASVSLSLYCLVVFYMATKDHLAQWTPLPKFLCVKAIVFFSYWQGLGISILVALGLIHDTPELSADHIATFLQSWLICLEMVGGALGHWISFSYHDYVPVFRLAGRVRLFHAVRDALGLKDVFVDAKSAWSGHQYTYRYFDPIVPVDQLDTQTPLPAPQRKRTLSSILGRHSSSTSLPLSGNGQENERALVNSSTVASTPLSHPESSLHSSSSSTSLSNAAASASDSVLEPGAILQGVDQQLAEHATASMQPSSSSGNPIKERRLRAGMRYTQGGKKTYWLPVDPVDHRAVAFAAGGAGKTRARLMHGTPSAGALRSSIEFIGSTVHTHSRATHESRRVQRATVANQPDERTRLVSSTPMLGHDLAALSMDLGEHEMLRDEVFYDDARTVEGDFNYPVVEVGVAFGFSRRRPYGHTFTGRRSSVTGGRPALQSDMFAAPASGYGAFA